MLSKMSLGRCCIITLTVALLASRATAEFKDLLGRIPSDANAIVAIDIDQLMKSPLAGREGWKQKQANAYASKPVVVPPEATRMVMAALIDPSDMETIWEVSVMDLSKTPSLELMARAEGGYVDKLGQAPAVWSPINAYFIQFDRLVLGAACPANRQFASRWAARKLALPGNSLSAYLANAAGAVGTETPIVMAMDLQDVTCATKVRRRLAAETFASLEGKNPDLDALSQVLGSIRGVTLRVAIGQEATGKGVVDFDSDTAILASFAQPLLLELLSQSGALIDDFETWRVSAKGKQVSFEGKLSTDGLRRLLSVVEPPAPREDGQSASGKPAASEKDIKAAASQQYFKAVREIIQQLDKKAQGGRSGTLYENATWMKRDASAISRLPILNVDPDLVKFAAEVSTRLNDAARVMTEGALQTRARTSGIVSTHDGKAVAQRHQALNEERAKTVTQAGEIFRGIKAAAEQIRIEMTSRYQVEF